ncbi:hypothetical protein AB205_0092700 [Aquarana catesbeiana]|uniref:Uncharacterized protein n=1 Tax=Aquarana catesbeiana TaxID=8400 RepID=A0A2G9RU57_AQUCT|nr:hypothetical protein AB205_0092700 [Aquarana catesbeiana]
MTHVLFCLARKIPPASSSSSMHAPHRTSTNSVPVSQSMNNTGFLPPSTVTSPQAPVTSPSTSADKVLPQGTTLNIHTATEATSSMQARQVSSSSSASTPSVLSSSPSPVSSKPQKLKSNKAVKPKESPASSTNCSSTNSSSSGSGKKKKTNSPPQLLAPPPSHSTESIRKNCVANSGTYHSPGTTLSQHGSPHSVGLNFVNNRSVSLKHDQSGRGPPSGNPAESIKRMSVVMNSSDSTLSLGPFVHQAGGDQAVNSHNVFPHSRVSLDKLTGKKRKCSAGPSSITNNSSKSSKVAKLPPVNNIHSKHNSGISGTPTLANNSLRHQPKARP